MMLEAKDARDESEAPSRKTSVGVQPPWECSSRKASRREEVSVGTNWIRYITANLNFVHESGKKYIPW